MKILKVLNNNVVTVKTEAGEEVIIMGCGLAFGKKRGDIIDSTKIEKIFTQTREDKNLYKKLEDTIERIPAEYIDITEKIVKLAEEQLQMKLSDTVYITLSDHIYFAVKRFSDGQSLKNILFWEIKSSYKDEYLIGQKALEIVKNGTGVSLPDDEAGFIALHIVNAELNENMMNVMIITKIIKEITNIVKYYFNVELDEENQTYYRFIVHLKFLAQRLLNNATCVHSNDDELFNVVKTSYKESFMCTVKIFEHIKKNYNYSFSKDEMVYLSIHIEKLRKEWN
jgi:beta-glucoside operon transcriptional antiterminator